MRLKKKVDFILHRVLIGGIEMINIPDQSLLLFSQADSLPLTEAVCDSTRIMEHGVV